eukprot:gnl/MRDRNA2_/MRDRNA2_131566_c0_seq1.p1 gnl/MRDRNA2_/MRDRNA2_131566_c0~~gnl/MRDRNA2_/MRDRNA2_131566_c0_seq1.p1  ORF type:complete len:391 (+),score=88.42 gnl/MRDRNA2_/MRDRNA2_131566_c0_seq1:161-1333(+)
MLKVGGLLQKAAGAGGDLLERAGEAHKKVSGAGGDLLERAGGGAGGLLEKVRAKSDLDPLGAALRKLLNTESAAVPREVLEDLCGRAAEDPEGAGARVGKHIESHLKANSLQWRRIHGALALLDHAVRICPADIEALEKWGIKLPELRTELRDLKSFDRDKDERVCKLVQNKATVVDRELEKCGIPGPPTVPKPKPQVTEGAGVKKKDDSTGGPKVAKVAAPKVAITPVTIPMGRFKFEELPTPQSPQHSDGSASDKEEDESEEASLSQSLYPKKAAQQKVDSSSKRPEPEKVSSSGFSDWGLKKSIEKINDARDKVISKLPVREASLPEPKATLVGARCAPEYTEEQHNLLGGVNVKKDVLKETQSSADAANETSSGGARKCCWCFRSS